MVNRLDAERMGRLAQALMEGNFCHGASRVAEVAFNTVCARLDRAAPACVAIYDKLVRGLCLESLQADELWSFVYVEAKRVADAKSPPEFAGDVWT